MLDHVSKAQLFFALVDPAHIETEAHNGGVLGRFITQDGVFHAVRQPAEAHVGIGRDVVDRHTPGGFSGLCNRGLSSVLRHHRCGLQTQSKQRQCGQRTRKSFAVHEKASPFVRA